MDRGKADNLARELEKKIQEDPLLAALKPEVESKRLLTEVTPPGISLLYSNMLQSLLNGLRETSIIIVIVSDLVLPGLFPAPLLPRGPPRPAPP